MAVDLQLSPLHTITTFTITTIDYGILNFKPKEFIDSEFDSIFFFIKEQTKNCKHTLIGAFIEIFSWKMNSRSIYWVTQKGRQQSVSPWKWNARQCLVSSFLVSHTNKWKMLLICPETII